MAGDIWFYFEPFLRQLPRLTTLIIDNPSYYMPQIPQGPYIAERATVCRYPSVQHLSISVKRLDANVPSLLYQFPAITRLDLVDLYLRDHDTGFAKMIPRCPVMSELKRLSLWPLTKSAIESNITGLKRHFPSLRHIVHSGQIPASCVISTGVTAEAQVRFQTHHHSESTLSHALSQGFYPI